MPVHLRRARPCQGVPGSCAHSRIFPGTAPPFLKTFLYRLAHSCLDCRPLRPRVEEPASSGTRSSSSMPMNGQSRSARAFARPSVSAPMVPRPELSGQSWTRRRPGGSTRPSGTGGRPDPLSPSGSWPRTADHGPRLPSSSRRPGAGPSSWSRSTRAPGPATTRPSSSTTARTWSSRCGCNRSSRSGTSTPRPPPSPGTVPTSSGPTPRSSPGRSIPAIVHFSAPPSPTPGDSRRPSSFAFATGAASGAGSSSRNPRRGRGGAGGPRRRDRPGRHGPPPARRAVPAPRRALARDGLPGPARAGLRHRVHEPCLHGRDGPPARGVLPQSLAPAQVRPPRRRAPSRRVCRTPRELLGSPPPVPFLSPGRLPALGRAGERPGLRRGGPAGRDRGCLPRRHRAGGGRGDPAGHEPAHEPAREPDAPRHPEPD